MVFGGQAVLMYGEPRFTQDIDITLGIDTSAEQPDYPPDIATFFRKRFLVTIYSGEKNAGARPSSMNRTVI